MSTLSYVHAGWPMDPRSCDRMKVFSDRVSEGARTHTVCLVMAMVMVMVMVMM